MILICMLKQMSPNVDITMRTPQQRIVTPNEGGVFDNTHLHIETDVSYRRHYKVNASTTLYTPNEEGIFDEKPIAFFANLCAFV